MPKAFGWSEENVSLSALRDLRNQPTNGIDVIDRLMVGNISTATLAVTPGSAGTVRFTHFTPTRTITVSNITSSCHPIAGVYTSATGVVAKMGLYTVASNGSVTLVASTANDTTLWTSTGIQADRALNTPYTLQAGQRYAAAAVLYCTGGTITVPSMSGLQNSSSLMGAQPAIATTITSGANSQDLPAGPVTPSSVGQAVWFRLT